ncbi:MBOAT family O-acyltransferase [Gorillibacterium massiliense]|uniref:MBOAT family O-acyltransferase n=1 Tax=Gorillibacterium massiliense TaxID=1280390 RepID=UPI0004AF390C|nr:MBOAT family O-acyltransferase [Gorillibacterium massiliense]
MLFHTPEFFVFLTATLVLYYAFPKARLAIMALANALFYAATGLGYLALFIGIVSFVYLCSKQFGGKRGKGFFALALTVVIGNLLFFKYSLFMLRSLESSLHLHWLAGDSYLAKVVLPIGISFYTFQLIAYIIDVNRGKLAPARSYLEFWVFISYFAHSLAGPILRGNDFLPQLEKLKAIKFSDSRFRLGLSYLALGLFKKIVLADWITPIVDQYFAHGAAMTGGEAWIASYLFAFQIYFDFSAYSEMAVGIGYLMGLRLDLNFRTPYLSGNGTEFWARWHITLSSWIKDYVYIGLGGSRRGEIRRYVNLLAAMAISGLWHGAAWTFVAWGLMHGVLLVVHKFYVKLKKKWGWQRLDESRLYRWACVFVFFHVVCITWVLFRVSGMGNALRTIGKMFDISRLSFTGLYPYIALAALLFLLHIGEYLVRKHASLLSEKWHRFVPSPARAVVYTVFIVAIVLCMQSKVSNFIYFQF